MNNSVQTQNGFVVINASGGHAVIAAGSPLRRLRYFDGKFLRAADLQLEQTALLNQVRISNQAGGPGVVHGYTCTLLDGDRLQVGSGLAIDPLGRLLLLGDAVDIGIQELIEKSRLQTASSLAAAASKTMAAFDDCEEMTAEPPGEVLEDKSLYLITLSHVEGACGDEAVYGKLCEEACITSSERPYFIEGVVIRAVPLNLDVLLAASRSVALSATHLRSRVASAYFEQERGAPASLISRQGLTSSIWCQGAEAPAGSQVPIAVIARSGGTTLFLDAWTARRERMDPPPRNYWAGRMAMRPWNVFLAQILQFQCQLTRCITQSISRGEDDDPCAREHRVAADAAEEVKRFLEQYAASAKQFEISDSAVKAASVIPVAGLKQLQADLSRIAKTAVTQRYLINCGIVELPSAGYLPVNPNKTLTVNDQVRRMMGEGVDLRFCVVRPDYVPHALETAQHMARISLLEGIDDPSAKPRVDVLVPDGRIETFTPVPVGRGYAMSLTLGQAVFSLFSSAAATVQAAALKSETKMLVSGLNISRLASTRAMQGAARSEALETGGTAFYFAGQTEEQTTLAAAAGVASQSVLTLLGDGGSSTSGTSGGSESTGAASADGTATAGSRTVHLSSNVSTGAGVDMINEIPAAGLQRLASGLRINTNIASRQPWQGIWTTLRCEQDPFELGRGRSTPVNATSVLALVATVKQTVVVTHEIRLNGTLHIEDILESGVRGKIKARLTGEMILRGSVQGAQGTGQSSVAEKPYKLSEKIYLQKTASRGTDAGISITVINPTPWSGLGYITMVFQRSWGTADTAAFSATMRVSAGDKTTGVAKTAVMAMVSDDSVAAVAERSYALFSGRQQIDSDVLSPGNALHDASLAALKRIGGALEDKQFANDAARLLFPPPEQAPEELQVYARRDWVLFHRRREIQCGYAITPEDMVQTRRYRVYHVSLGQAGEVKALYRALAANNSLALAQFDLQPATRVEFEAGIPSLSTPAIDVRTDWQQQVTTDADIVFGVIASSGDALDEGETIALARLDSLTDVLAPLIELAPDADLVTLPQVPDPLAGGNVDGVIVLATLDIATICHRLYRLEISADELKALLTRLNGSNFAELLEKIQATELSPEAVFRSGTTTLFGDQAAAGLARSWNSAGDGAVSQVVTIARTGEFEAATGPAGELVKGQAAVIANAMGGSVSADSVHLVETDITLPVCPAITLLATEPRIELVCNDIHYMILPSTSPDQTLVLVREMIEKQGYQNLLQMAEKKQFTLEALASMEFNAGTAEAPPASVQALAEAWNGLEFTTADGSLPDQVITRVVSISPQGADPATLQSHLQQAQLVAEKLSLSQGVAAIQAVNGETVLPSACDAITLIFIASTISAIVTHVPAMVTTEGDDGASEVAGLASHLTFDAAGNLVRDSAFEAAVAELKSAGTKLGNIELVTTADTVPEKTDPRAVSLLKVLKEAGVVKTRATIKVRAADDKEKKIIAAGGADVKDGFVFNR